MSGVGAWSSGKTHRDENFPVASRLIAPHHRAAVLAFYRFARAADDVADHPGLGAAGKLRLLDRMEATLGGRDDAAEAAPLRDVLARRGLSARHPCRLLEAFRLDVTRTRYATWAELMEYCSLSAMPVGRFVLDLHGEKEATWPASDALCAALQVINHLQDCGRDYRDLGRVYLPLDILAGHGAEPADLGGAPATPALLAAIRATNERTRALLDLAAPLSGQVRDRRLGIEIAVIGRLAATLNGRLARADPLATSVRLDKRTMIGVMLGALTRATPRWLERSTRRRGPERSR